LGTVARASASIQSSTVDHAHAAHVEPIEEHPAQARQPDGGHQHQHPRSRHPVLHQLRDAVERDGGLAEAGLAEHQQRLAGGRGHHLGLAGVQHDGARGSAGPWGGGVSSSGSGPSSTCQAWSTFWKRRSGRAISTSWPPDTVRCVRSRTVPATSRPASIGTWKGSPSACPKYTPARGARRQSTTRTSAETWVSGPTSTSVAGVRRYPKHGTGTAGSAFLAAANRCSCAAMMATSSGLGARMSGTP
jgi:hypothetical protein